MIKYIKMGLPSKARPHRPRRQLAIGLRGLMLLILVIGLWLAHRVDRARQQRHALAILEAAGAKVAFDWQEASPDDLPALPPWTRPGIPRAPAWLVRWLGPEYFQEVTFVRFTNAHSPELNSDPWPTVPDPDLGPDVPHEEKGRRVKAYERELAAAYKTHLRAPLERKRQRQVGALGALNFLPALKDLTLSDDQASPVHLRKVARIETLRVLTIDDSSFGREGLEVVAGMSQVRELSLFPDGPPLDDRGAAIVARMSGLSRLTAFRSCLSDEGLARLASLRELKELSLFACPPEDATLGEPAVTDAGLSHLARMPRLQRLRLVRFEAVRSMRFTDAGLAHLAGMSGLTDLELIGAAVSDRGLEHLAGLDGLKDLVLSCDGVTDDGLATLSRLTGLEGLSLEGARVSNMGLAHLRGLSNLRVLAIERAEVGDPGFTALAGVTGLRSLVLVGARPSDRALLHLARLPELMWVEFDLGGLSPAGLTAFRQARPGLTLKDGSVDPTGWIEK